MAAAANRRADAGAIRGRWGSHERGGGVESIVRREPEQHQPAAAPGMAGDGRGSRAAAHHPDGNERETRKGIERDTCVRVRPCWGSSFSIRVDVVCTTQPLYVCEPLGPAHIGPINHSVQLINH